MNKETLTIYNTYGEDKYRLEYWENHRNKLDDLVFYIGFF